MLTRVYIDNFRCLQKFEVRFGPRNLILGGNGAGKSSLMAAIFWLSQFVDSDRAEDAAKLFGDRTRWAKQARQTFEIEAALQAGVFVYRLELEAADEAGLPRVALESVTLGESVIFRFAQGKVQMYDGAFGLIAEYPYGADRSAFATAYPGDKNVNLAAFRRWMAQLLCFRLNPFDMGPQAEREAMGPTVNLANFSAWYRHLVQSYPLEANSYRESLVRAIEGFRALYLDAFGEKRLLLAEFGREGGDPVRFGFGQLSDGQRCLMCLYAILHFLVARGATVFIDEPDNFISLREIQPWLTALTDMVDSGRGQAILISHHPEILNQWAAQTGLQFLREGAGPVRVLDFEPVEGGWLTPAEAIARGWVNE